MSTSKKTILVVDDDKSILRTFTRILQKSGYEIEVAETGKEAMEKAAAAEKLKAEQEEAEKAKQEALNELYWDRGRNVA